MRIFASGPLRIPIDLAYYLTGKLFSVLFPLTSAHTKAHAVGRLGNITISGEEHFVENCLTALNVLLPKYDPALYELLKSGHVRLGFYDQDRESENLLKKSYPSCVTQGFSKSKRPVYVSFFAAGY